MAKTKALGEVFDTVWTCINLTYFKNPKEGENNCVATFVRSYNKKVDEEWVEKTETRKRWLFLPTGFNARDIILHVSEAVEQF